MTTGALEQVFVIGDSLTIQFGPYLEEALAEKFRYDRKRNTEGEHAEADLDVPRGANAGDSGGVLAYLRWCRAHQPIQSGILLLSCGLHDIKVDCTTRKRAVSPPDFEKNLRAILDEAAGMGLKVVWLRIAPVMDEVHNMDGGERNGFLRFSNDVETYNEVADRVMQERGVESIDFHRFCLELIPEAYIDHVHYNDDALRKQGHFIASEIINRFG